MKLQNGLNVVLNKGFATYAQSGEDVIIKYLFDSININKPSYLDIGTNHPIKGNNTYFFYLRKSFGVCIEPDITLIDRIKKYRKNDIILNVGIGITEEKNASFYYFDGEISAWNTFSLDEAENRKKQSGISYKKSFVELMSINTIVDNYFNGKVNFVSIDVEGLDLEILKSFDFNKYQPEVICVETILFSLKNNVSKNQEIIDYMKSNNYIVYADTNINTIFCRKDLF